MNAIKERLIGAITVMNDDDAIRLWEDIQRDYNKTWDDIPEEKPDKWDLEMIKDAKNNPDCQTFATREEVEAVLNAN